MFTGFAGFGRRLVRLSGLGLAEAPDVNWTVYYINLVDLDLL